MECLSISRMPVFDSAGAPHGWASYSWKFNIDYKKGTLAVTASDLVRRFKFEDVLCLKIHDEKEVTAIGKTIGRMALTGIGTALFSKGRKGGTGAGLLDLSFRGAEHKNVISGAFIWPDTTVINFAMDENYFERLEEHLYEDSCDDEAEEAADRLLDLFNRMCEDGGRAVDELAREILNLSKASRSAYAAAEQLKNFKKRDAARERAREIDDEIQENRFMLFALLAANNISFSGLID